MDWKRNAENYNITNSHTQNIFLMEEMNGWNCLPFLSKMLVAQSRPILQPYGL